MKHYLLTWYGVTDLRAALGFGPTDGPILSALKTKKYTDVVILAYTNPNKSSQGFTVEIRAKWEKWRGSDVETRLQMPRDIEQQIVDAVANTDAGHEIFNDWLTTELKANGVCCAIQIMSRELRHLNDAPGIFDAAAFAVTHALADTSEKTITTYVSPGTPVMAYTWALIARAHPQYSITVIASSDPRVPPETIDLPKNMLMPVVAGPKTAKPSEYDAIIHLLGRERMPIYFGMLQFKAGLHVFITTQDYQRAVNDLSRCLPKACQCRTVTIQDAFKPADTRRAIEKQVSKLPSTARVAVNLTGGTKLMFAGALSACWACGLEPFYFEINNHNIIFIRDGLTVPFKGAKSVTDFFVVNGFSVITNGRWEENPCRAERKEVTKELWDARQTLGKLSQTSEFRKYRVPWGKGRNPPFSWKWGDSQASFDSKGNLILILNGKSYRISACDDYEQYLGGGWLEEYVCSLLRELEERRVIHDVRIGVKVSYSGRSQDLNVLHSGEFDCVFTDGKRLWLVECKAGNVTQEHIQKLENNLKTYGGIAARGILVSAFPILAAHEKRLKSTTSIRAIQPEELRVEVLERVISL